MPDSRLDEVERLRSLRRRGLISAAGYASGMAARGVPLPADPFQKPPLVVRTRPGIGMHVFAVLVAMIGSLLGIIGVIFEELRANLLLGPFVAAPIIEEALKPAGVLLLLLRWPHALVGRLHAALLAALGGLCFALVESYVYVTWYFPDEGPDYVLFRFTVPVLMHTLASFLVGLGLTRGVIDWAAGRAPFPKRTRNYYFAAVALHAIYNVAVAILAITGELRFD
jgi:RsiW-degrading membrane proteinase PrsW (M82 family)